MEKSLRNKNNDVTMSAAWELIEELKQEEKKIRLFSLVFQVVQSIDETRFRRFCTDSNCFHNPNGAKSNMTLFFFDAPLFREAVLLTRHGDIDIELELLPSVINHSFNGMLQIRFNTLD